MTRVAGAVGIALALTLAAPSVLASPAGQPAEVRVLDTSGPGRVPCPKVETRGHRFIRGGCRARAYEFTTKLTIRTVFGAMRFGDCTTNFDVTFAADGRMWFDNLRIGGAAPCSDVWPCAPPSAIALRKHPTAPPPLDKVPPWHGRIVAADGGSFTAQTNLCFDTCAGRYRGDVDIELIRHDGGWIMRARSAGVGATSLEIEGSWDFLEPADFDIVAR